MTVYASSHGYYYEVHIDLRTNTVSSVTRYRGNTEQRGESVDFDSLDANIVDLILSKLRKALNDKARSEHLPPDN